MKIITRLFLLITFPLLLITSSCSKDSSTIKAEGTVIDKTTNKIVPGAVVNLVQNNKSNLLGLGHSAIASQKADENGRFSFTFTKDKDYTYNVEAVKEMYVNNGNNYASIPKNGSANLVIPLQPEAYLKLHIINANPVDENDYISVNNSFSSGGGGPFVGKSVDTKVIGKVRGNVMVPLVWFVRKNNIQNIYRDSIYCPAFDTTLYEIKY